VYISLRTHLAPVTLLESELEKELKLSHTVRKGLRVVPEQTEPTTTPVYRDGRFPPYLSYTTFLVQPFLTLSTLYQIYTNISTTNTTWPSSSILYPLLLSLLIITLILFLFTFVPLLSISAVFFAFCHHIQMSRTTTTTTTILRLSGFCLGQTR